MTEISRKSLFSKLNKLAFQSIESATVLCKLRGNPYVELVHWIAHVIELPDSDWHRIIRSFELDAGKIVGQINQAAQHSAASSEQLAATAETMSHQANQLQEAMAFFKVGAPAPGRPAAPRCWMAKPFAW